MFVVTPDKTHQYNIAVHGLRTFRVPLSYLRKTVMLTPMRPGYSSSTYSNTWTDKWPPMYLTQHARLVSMLAMHNTQYNITEPSPNNIVSSHIHCHYFVKTQGPPADWRVGQQPVAYPSLCLSSGDELTINAPANTSFLDIRGQVPARDFHPEPILYFRLKQQRGVVYSSTTSLSRDIKMFPAQYCLANVSLLRLTLDPTLRHVITLSAGNGSLPLHSAAFYSAIWLVIQRETRLTAGRDGKIRNGMEDEAKPPESPASSTRPGVIAGATVSPTCSHPYSMFRLVRFLTARWAVCLD